MTEKRAGISAEEFVKQAKKPRPGYMASVAKEFKMVADTVHLKTFLEDRNKDPEDLRTVMELMFHCGFNSALLHVERLSKSDLTPHEIGETIRRFANECMTFYKNLPMEDRHE